MEDSTDKLINAVKHYQDSLERHTKTGNSEKLLHAIDKLSRLPIRVCHLEETGVGRTVNSLKKFDGKVGQNARTLVDKWKSMVKGEQEEEQAQMEQQAVSNEPEIINEEDTEPLMIVEPEKDIEKEVPQLNNSSHRKSSQDKNNSRHSTSSSNKTSRSSDNDRRKRRRSSSSDKSDDSSDSDDETSSEESDESPRRSKDKRKSRKSSSSETSSEDISSDDNRKKYKKSHSSDSESDIEPRSKSKSKHHHSKEKSSKEKDKHSSKVEKHDPKKENISKTVEKHHHRESSSSKKDESKKKDDSKKHYDKSKKDSAKSKDEEKKSHDKKRTRESSSDRSSKKHKSNSSSSSSGTNQKKEKEVNSDKNKNKESSKKSQSKDNVKSMPQSTSKKQLRDGIDSESGASFADVLGMLEVPTSSKGSAKRKSGGNEERKAEKSSKEVKAVKSKPNVMESPSKSPKQVPNLLKESNNLEPLDINISSLLPSITPNYRPLGVSMDSSPKKLWTDDEALTQVISAKHQRTKVYSGNKSGYTKVPSLFEMCSRILQDNLDALEYTGGVPYSILKPILEKANPDQLYQLEFHNPYLIEDSDELWQLHCQKEFRNKRREELETWREMYMRCLDEREAKLKALTANIKQSQDKSIPVRQTKLAYVDSVVKPPRNIARKQAKNGTAVDLKRPSQLPAERLSKDIKAGLLESVPNPRKVAVDKSTTSSRSSSHLKQKKAPLMAKTLSLLKSTFGRR